MGTIDAKRDFFISFTGADRPWARWLARVLTEEGYTYWFQDQDFKGNIPGNIAKAQEQSLRTIVILSEAYAKSGYSRSEWQMRYQEDPGGEKDLLILFRVDQCAVADPLLGRFAYVDLFVHGAREVAARKALVDRLRQAVEPGFRPELGAAPYPGACPINAPFPLSQAIAAPSGSEIGSDDRVGNQQRQTTEDPREKLRWLKELQDEGLIDPVIRRQFQKKILSQHLGIGAPR